MKKFLLIILLIIIEAGILKSQTSIWSDIPEGNITLTGSRYIIPDFYRVLKMNLDVIKPLLKSAPMEFTATAKMGKSIIYLPLPDETFQRFTFWESPTMEPDLQAKYPEIRTYSGQGIDDPYASLKFDLTPEGFHAQILSVNGRVFIDPYDMGDINNYICYYAKDYQKENAEFECQVLYQDEYAIPEPGYFENLVLPPSGPQLRTYRLANAATGEYTIFHGGTVVLGLAAVNTSINRVNGVYEKEVAVRMVLVANNDLIIYTDPNTDPYTNTNGSLMLTQNINNLNSVIGSSNYDIGHVFSTGGGGVAYLGCVCTSSKAGGVTGSPTPIGDPFDIDYVAHEMGHQFGGNHTFNGNTGSCAGNRNASTAYEPGSGSTIMAYAGICSPYDLQDHSDAYFHSISFDEIRAYTTAGNGNSCAVITSTGNNAPTISVPSGGFYIPKSTPFSLTGSATDPDIDPLTYCWEEFDLGPAGDPNSPSGNAPIFRSFNPVTSPKRTFPKLSDLLNNTQTIGEILPTYGRNLTFRLTARDNRSGGGGVDYNQVAFNVDGNSGPFIVTSPNTSVAWLGNTQQTVTWNVANTNASPVSCSNVEILLSTDGGISFNTVLTTSTPNDGSEIITLPNIPTAQARIKVEAAGNIFFDISNVNFIIINNPGIDDPASFAAETVNDTQVDLNFTPNSNNNNVVIVWNLDGTFTPPSGSLPAVGQPFAGGTLLYNGIVSPVNHTGLNPNTEYFYKAFSYDGDTYSTGITANAKTLLPLDFSVQMTVSDNCGNHAHSLIFGTATGATDCFDEGLDLSAPPPPPVGILDARFNSCSDAFFTDIRGTNTNSETIWNLQYQPGDGCNPVSFSWDPGDLPPDGYFHLVDPFLGTLVNVNMRLTDNYSDVMNLGYLQIKYNYLIQSGFHVSQGWNMLSLPVDVINNYYLTLFPNAVSGTLYGFSGGYISVDSIKNCEGYWLKFPDSETAEVYGSDRTECVINLPAGWNMIGGPGCIVSINDVVDPGGIIVPGTLYGYSGSYVSTNLIAPTKGYWIKTNTAGTITISCGGSLAKKIDNFNIPAESYKEFVKVDINDESNKNQTLYFNGKLPESISLESFSLPPVPPEGSFDARFTGDYWLNQSDEVSIRVQSSNYPVTLKITNSDYADGSGYVLHEIADGVETGSQIIADGKLIVISDPKISLLKINKQNSLPTSYSLAQNYPNPFNPSTTIQFSIPENNNVLLTIYNMLGQRIAELVNGKLNAGWYSFQWDGKNAASGIYIYELRTEKFISMKKMILLK